MERKNLIKVLYISLFSGLLLAGCEKSQQLNTPTNPDEGLAANVDETIESALISDELDGKQLKTVIVEPNTEFYTETAYAKFPIDQGGYVFSDKSNPEGYPSLGMKNSKWGWAANLAEGSYLVPIYAGAGKNDIKKGVFVGRLKVIVSLDQIYVKYLLVDENFIKELHVYISDDEPTTNAPGQYGYTQVFDPTIQTYKYIFNDVVDLNGDGKFWIIAHAEVNIH